MKTNSFESAFAKAKEQSGDCELFIKVKIGDVIKHFDIQDIVVEESTSGAKQCFIIG